MKTDYFKKIDTADKAYWLGFITADGSVHKNRRNVQLELHIRDVDALKEFKKDLDLPTNISYRKSRPTASIGANNITIASDLIKLGIVPNKKYLGSPLPELPLDLMAHYVRGYFDGDGFIMVRKDGRNQAGFTGHPDFISCLQDFLHQVNVLTFRRKLKTTSTYSELGISNKLDLKNLYEFMYKESTFHLKRKQEKFLCQGEFKPPAQ